MPVYLRRFYYDKLLDAKKTEKKKMDDHNKKEKLSKNEKELLKNPAFTKELAKFNKMIQKGKDDISKEAEKYGIKLKKF